jgi:hypothetical protein
MVGVWTYAWRSPTGVIHGGDPFSMQTACGIRVPAHGQRRDWKAIIRRVPTCERCGKQHRLGS